MHHRTHHAPAGRTSSRTRRRSTPEIRLAGKRLLVSWNLTSHAADLDHLVDPVAAKYGPRFAAIRIPRRGHR
jgi:hypothetical protein